MFAQLIANNIVNKIENGEIFHQEQGFFVVQLGGNGIGLLEMALVKSAKIGASAVEKLQKRYPKVEVKLDVSEMTGLVYFTFRY